MLCRALQGFIALQAALVTAVVSTPEDDSFGPGLHADVNKLRREALSWAFQVSPEASLMRRSSGFGTSAVQAEGTPDVSHHVQEVLHGHIRKSKNDLNIPPNTTSPQPMVTNDKRGGHHLQEALHGNLGAIHNDKATFDAPKSGDQKTNLTALGLQKPTQPPAHIATNTTAPSDQRPRIPNGRSPTSRRPTAARGQVQNKGSKKAEGEAARPSAEDARKKEMPGWENEDDPKDKEDRPERSKVKRKKKKKRKKEKPYAANAYYYDYGGYLGGSDLKGEHLKKIVEPPWIPKPFWGRPPTEVVAVRQSDGHKECSSTRSDNTWQVVCCSYRLTEVPSANYTNGTAMTYLDAHDSCYGRGHRLCNMKEIANGHAPIPVDPDTPVWTASSCAELPSEDLTGGEIKYPPTIQDAPDETQLAQYAKQLTTLQKDQKVIESAISKKLHAMQTADAGYFPLPFMADKRNKNVELFGWSLNVKSSGRKKGEGNVIVGVSNNAEGASNSFVAGENNIAWGDSLAVTGGWMNKAEGHFTSILGGQHNLVSKAYGSVLGGMNNSAAGYGAVISGGESNSATGENAVVVGGYGNDASGRYAEVNAGYANVAKGEATTVVSGTRNEAGGKGTALSGGMDRATNAANYG